MLQHHILLDSEHLDGNQGLGRYVMLPGDRSRALKITEHLTDLKVVENPRGHTAYLGRLEGGPDEEPIDVLVISTGMGCPSVEIVVHELLECGARRLLRIGSCGSLRDELGEGNVVVATGAVRDEGTSPHYAPLEFPALAHPRAIAALVEGAERTGLAARTYLGIVHSKDSLYAREFGKGPAGKGNEAYMEWIARAGTIASEMEAAALFVLAAARSFPAAIIDRDVRSVQAGCVLAVFGDGRSMEFKKDVAIAAERRAITVAIEGIRAWARADRAL